MTAGDSGYRMFLTCGGCPAYDIRDFEADGDKAALYRANEWLPEWGGSHGKHEPKGRENLYGVTCRVYRMYTPEPGGNSWVNVGHAFWEFRRQEAA